MNEQVTYLSAAEIATLTNRLRYGAQSRELAKLGIEHKRRGDGSIVVLRAHHDVVLTGARNDKPKGKTTPNFALVA